MKRFVSIVLTIIMIVSMFTTVSAKSIGDMTAGVANPMELLLSVETLARKSGTVDAYSDSLDISEGKGLLDGIGVDYKSTLNMQPIRALFDRNFISSILPKDADAQAEFNAGKVNTTVVVEITYPVSSDVKVNLQTAGILDAGSIFEEASRTVVGNTVKITYVNREDLLVSELLANKDTYLKDISFELVDAIVYNKYNDYAINVKLTGSTEIEFASKTQVVNYTGESSHIVSANAEHVLVVEPVIPATCETKGRTEGVRCQTHDSYTCGANGTIEPTWTIPALGHITPLVKVAGISATCITTGVKEHYVCVRCKKDYSDINANNYVTPESLVIAKTKHSWVNYENEVPATCTENGLTAGQICSVCGTFKTRNIIPATGHTEVTVPAVAAGCENSGSTEGKSCSVCNKVLVAAKPIPAKGHKWGEWNVTADPTENSVGSKTRTCLNGCGKSETVEIPKLEHVCKVDTSVVTKEATCTETGLKQNYCACGEPVGEPIVIPAVGHKAEKISGYVKATCTEEGVLEHWGCSNCGGLFTDAACNNKITSARIPLDFSKEGHSTNIVELAAVAPTCTQDGLDKGEKCVACKMILDPQEIVSATGHNFETVAGKAATCTEIGIHEHLHCTVCNVDYTSDKSTLITAADYELPALGHSFNYVGMTIITPPTNVTKGVARIDCDRCDHYKTVDIAVLEHTHNEICEKIITPATCTTNGLKRRVYTCCNEIAEDNIVIPASHNAREIAKVDPGCYETGVEKHWYCSVCDKLFKDAECTQEVTMQELILGKEDHHFVHHRINDDYAYDECSKCGDIRKYKENDKFKVIDHGSDKKKEDKVKEERYNEEEHKNDTGRKMHVYPETNGKEKEISSKLEHEIHKDDSDSKKASEEKVVIDITVERVTVYVAKDNNTAVEYLTKEEILDEEREFVTETTDIKVIEIAIPESMRGFVDFMVHRLHDGKVEILTTTKNADGECIEISDDKSKITLHVNKFSEYAIVGYDTIVNTPENNVVNTGGSGASKTSTVKFNTNGGTIIESITVERNGYIKDMPVTTKEGYVFVGWFTDYSLTKQFDPATMPVTSSMTLYAKWAERSASGDCPGTAESGCPCYNFTDLDGSQWYHDGVHYAIENGLMKGVSTEEFAPDESLTRAMLVTVLYRKEGEPATNRSIPFADVDMSEYYANAVSWAQQNGVVTGYSDTEFGPNDSITREQIAAIMFRYAQLKGMNAVTLEENLHFADADEISEYAVSAMNWAVGSGLMKGRTETTLNPTANTTRAEIAVVLYRFFETIAK